MSKVEAVLGEVISYESRLVLGIESRTNEEPS